MGPKQPRAHHGQQAQHQNYRTASHNFVTTLLLKISFALDGARRSRRINHRIIQLNRTAFFRSAAL
jgi:hypothetical protein